MIKVWGFDVNDLHALVQLAAERRVSKIGLIKEIRNGMGFDLITTKGLVELHEYYAPFGERGEETSAREFIIEIGCE